MKCNCGCLEIIPDNHTYLSSHTGSLSGLFKLSDPFYCYLFGFLQADGSYEEDPGKRGGIRRGRVRIELSHVDVGLLKAIQQLLPVNSSLRARVRDTNFKKNYKSSILSISNIIFREKVKKLGLLPGKKSLTAKPPHPISNDNHKNYLRGLIDGDGSLGITSLNRCFISLNTSSDFIKEYYVNYIHEKIGKEKTVNRNSRDNTYNIVVFDEDAQKLTKSIYPPGCFALNRKKEKAKMVLDWKRPENRAKRTQPQQRWTEEHDLFILNHTVEESILSLKRSKSSVKTRLWRLRTLVGYNE